MNILVTGAWQQAHQYKETIESLGHKVCFLQWEKDPLPCEPSWVEGIIGNGIFLSHPIDSFANLRYIQLTSAGFDRVPMDYVEEHNIKIHNARGVYSIPMAEYALAGVLSLYKQMAAFHKNQQNHLWEKCRGLQELTDKKVLILGTGSVGEECAKRFTAFGCQVIGMNRHPREQEYFDRTLSIRHLMEELPETDILVLTLPLTEETGGILGREQLKAMKESAVLVNIARGALVDQDALIDALEKKELQAAVLDVFDTEPLEGENRLWEMENVIITPHNSFVGEKNQQRLGKVIIDNLRQER